MAFAVPQGGTPGKKPSFWQDPIGALITPGLNYDPYSTQLANTSYDLYQQAQALQNPAANALISYATDPNAAQQAAQQASAAAATQTTSQQSLRDRLNKLAGITLSPAQQAQQSLQDSLGMAESTAGASNTARAATGAAQAALLAK